MSFLKKIFKPKAGGTFAGNLIRGTVNKATNGILGNGAMLKATEIKNGWRDPSTGQLTKAGLESMNAPAGATNPAVEKVANYALETKQGEQIAQAGFGLTLKSFWDKYKHEITVALVAILAYVQFGMENKNKRKSRRKK